MVNLPEPFSSLPREHLLYAHPSPIEPLSRLSAEIPFSNAKHEGINGKYWIKREDSNSGLAFGGSKLRKLEYIMPDVKTHGATTIVTTGGLQSNHMTQVAAVGARYGIKTLLIPRDMVPASSPAYTTAGNIQLSHLLSASQAPTDSDVEKVLRKCRDDGEIPYWIPSGASTHPLGGLGFARFAFEIAEQEREMGVYFDTIVTACASGSTLGGMVAGFKLLERTASKSEQESALTSSGETQPKRKIIGIDAFARSAQEGENSVLQIARTAAAKIGLQESDIQAEDVRLDVRWNAGQYGVLDDRTREAISALASLEGVIVDPVYTGKALTGMIGIARLGELKESKNVLFIHTGGVAALSAYPDVK